MSSSNRVEGISKVSSVKDVQNVQGSEQISGTLIKRQSVDSTPINGSGKHSSKIDAIQELERINGLIPPTRPNTGIFQGTRFAISTYFHEKKLERSPAAQEIAILKESLKNDSNKDDSKNIPVADMQKINQIPKRPYLNTVNGPDKDLNLSHQKLAMMLSTATPLTSGSIPKSIRAHLACPESMGILAKNTATGNEVHEQVGLLLDVRQAVHKENLDVEELQNIAQKYLFKNSPKAVNLPDKVFEQNMGLIDEFTGKITTDKKKLLDAIGNSIGKISTWSSLERGCDPNLTAPALISTTATRELPMQNQILKRLTGEGQNSIPKEMSEALATPNGTQKLLDFAEEQHSKENIDFLVKVLEVVSEPRMDPAKVKDLFYDYMTTSSTQEININYEQKNRNMAVYNAINNPENTLTDRELKTLVLNAINASIGSMHECLGDMNSRFRDI
jgi:hypothetical protein